MNTIYKLAKKSLFVFVLAWMTILTPKQVFADVDSDPGGVPGGSCGRGAAWCYTQHNSEGGGWVWTLWKFKSAYNAESFKIVSTSNRPAARNFATNATVASCAKNKYDSVWILTNYAHPAGGPTGGELGISIKPSNSGFDEDEGLEFKVSTIASKNGTLKNNSGTSIADVIDTSDDLEEMKTIYKRNKKSTDPAWNNDIGIFCASSEDRVTTANSKSLVVVDGSEAKTSKYRHSDASDWHKVTKSVTKKAGQTVNVSFNHHLRMTLKSSDWDDGNKSTYAQYGIHVTTSTNNNAFGFTFNPSSHRGKGNDNLDPTSEIDKESDNTFKFYKSDYYPTSQHSCASSPHYRTCEDGKLKFGQSASGKHRYRYNIGWDSQTFSKTLPYVNTNTKWTLCERLKYRPYKITSDGDDEQNTGTGGTKACAEINIEPVHARVNPNSAVNINSTASPSNWSTSATASATVSAGSDVTIKFAHRGNYANIDGLPQNQMGSFKYTVAKVAEERTGGNGPSSGYTAGNRFSNVQVSATSNQTYGSDTFTFNINKEQINVDTTYKICQTNTLANNYHTNSSTYSTNTSYTTSSQACATVTVTPSEVTSYCSKEANGTARAADVNGYNFSNLSFSNLSGKTYGYTSVKNSTNSQSAKTSENSSDTKTIWAKPGDEIRFTHALCYGARRVTNIDNGNNSAVSASVKNKVNSISMTGGPNNNFLFQSRANQFATAVTFGGSQASTPNVLSAKTDYLSNYVARVYAPSNNAGTGAYNCTIKDENGSTKNQSNALSYMIQGRSNTSGCASAAKTAQSSMVGSTISEKMTYNPLELKYNNSNTSGSVSGADTYINTQASVNIPYNFKMGAGVVTKMSDEVTGESKIAFAGETISSSFKINVSKRKNSQISSTEYATRTPANTHVQAVSFTITESKLNEVVNLSSGSANGQRVGSDIILPLGSSTPSVCNWFRTRLNLAANACSIDMNSFGSLNKDGDLNGKEEGDFRSTSSVPDIDIGANTESTLICVAAGVFPADSHKQPLATDISSSMQGNGMASVVGSVTSSQRNTGFDWMVSDPSCQTIAKKPNFQVWGAAYSKGPIQTSLTKKDIEATSNESTFKPNAVFGSWSEFETISGSTVSGFGSGASLGFGTSRKFAVGNVNTTVQNPYAGYNKRKVSTATGTSYCELIRLTLGNTSCTATSNGVSSSGVEMQVSLASKLKAIYAGGNLPATQDGDTINFNDNGSNVKITDNGDKIISKNTATISSGINTNAVNTGHETQIVYVRNTLNINANITTNNSGYDASYYNAGGSGFVPQLIFIVDGNVNIGENVTLVDAWIITEGKINTCSSFKRASSGSDTTASGANVCSQKLRFNYPVIAKGGFELNRTAGALKGNGTQEDDGAKHANINLDNDGSVAPAEIFNLRSDALLWAYHQSKSNTQANIVYTSELPPRY